MAKVKTAVREGAKVVGHKKSIAITGEELQKVSAAIDSYGHKMDAKGKLEKEMDALKKEFYPYLSVEHPICGEEYEAQLNPYTETPLDIKKVFAMMKKAGKEKEFWSEVASCTKKAAGQYLSAEMLDKCSGKSQTSNRMKVVAI